MDSYKVLGITDILEVNEIVKDSKYKRLINLQESSHDKKISMIADEICRRNTRIALITGFSSSGKTTFGERLNVHLALNGKKTVVISLDDYFIEVEKMPRHEDGSYNLEEIECIDYDLFNKNIFELITKGETFMPVHDFATGRAKDLVKQSLSEDEIIIVEGIHAFNPILLSNISKGDKFYIYISPETNLTFNGGKILSNDTRFIRRMIRDNFFRNTAPEKTFFMWDSVSKGGIKNILPYKGTEDVFFSSFLAYEYNIFKKYALPLLLTIKNDSAYYDRAGELINMLQSFESMEDRLVPGYSFAREFIGESSISY